MGKKMKNKLKRLRLQKLKETRSESHQCTQDTVDFGFEMEPSECSSSGISSLSGTSSTPLKKSGVVGVKSAGCLEQVQRKRVKPKPSAAVKKPTNERQKEGGTHEGIPGKKRQKRKKAKISKGKSDENAEAVLSKRKAQPDEVESVPTKKVMGRICEISSTSTQFFNFAEWIDSHRDQLSSLSADLKFYFSKNCQSQATLERKLHLRAYIHDQIRTRFPNSLLIAVGSTVNKTGSETSDLDLCLVVPCRSGRFPNDKSYGTEILRQVRNSLRRCPEFQQPAELIPAKVPIARIITKSSRPLEIDINVNNVIGIHNSHLLHYYSACDQRFPVLSLVVKHWATQAGIKDAMNGTFNSYSLALMVLHYLQQVKPPVLPNLQELFPEHFNSQRPLEQLQLYQETPEFSGRYANTQNVGELLVGFFDYFINRFDYQSWAISIRTASVIDRYSNLPEETDRFFLYIEEPFDLSNTARALRYPNEITIAFSETLKKLLEKPHMSTLGIY